MSDNNWTTFVWLVTLRGALWFFNCFDMKHTYLK